MRIVLVSESFPPVPDDVSTTVRHVLDRLIDDDHEVRLITSAPGLGSYRGVRVVRVSTPSRGTERTSRGHQVRQALAAFAPDLVQVHAPGHLGRKALKHASRMGVARLTVQHDAVPERGVERWLQKVAGRSDRVLATSAWVARGLAEAGCAAHVWEPGVDVRAFTPALRDEHLHRTWARVPGSPATTGGAVVVGYAGPLQRRHGVRALTDLAAQGDLQMVVIGAGSQQGWLRLRMPATRFVGALGTGDLATSLASLDVLVHPGAEEGDCHALRMAAASRVPVVVPDAGAAADVVAHRATGLHYRAGEPGALLGAVRELAGDPLLRVRLGVQARSRVAHRSWAVAVTELTSMHHRAVSGAAEPRLSA